MRKIGDGAEAIIYLDGNTVVKERIKKNYRISEIDNKLRKYRTRREAGILEKLSGFTPKYIEHDDKEMTIRMEYIEGKRVRDVINEDNFMELCTEIGKRIAELHNKDIIHADLTTSNMILNEQIYFIDFGLSFHSTKIEDKAVDLHLLRQALLSKHHEIFQKAYDAVISAYKKECYNPDEVLQRLERVEKRGRNKS